MSGYIKLYRSSRGTAIAQHPEYFAAWVHLLMMATHKERQQVVGTKTFTLKPGQLVFGRQKFSANTGISENKVRSALGVMKELGMITSKSHSTFSLITITKWSEYQGESPANHQQTTSKPPANHHKQECIKNGKNEQEVNTPPKSPKGESVNYDSWPEIPDEQILKDWIAARKKAKATHSQTAINTIGKQLHEAKKAGHSVDDCLSEAVVRGWRGFKAEWMQSAVSAQARQQASPRPSHRNEMPKPDRPDRR